MCKTNEVTIGDLLQTADASEMWMVTEVRENSKLPEWGETRRYRMDDSGRANNDNWRWDWIRLKNLVGDDSDRDLCLYWDPRKEHCGPQTLRTSTYYGADRLFLPEQAKALQDRLASQKGKEDWMNDWLVEFAEQVDWTPSPCSPPCYKLTAWLWGQNEFEVSNVSIEVTACLWEKTGQVSKKDMKPYSFHWTTNAYENKVRCNFTLYNAKDRSYRGETLDWSWQMTVTFKQVDWVRGESP